MVKSAVLFATAVLLTPAVMATPIDIEARMFRKIVQKMGQKLVKDPTYAQPLFDHASEAWDANHQNQHLNMQTHHMAHQAQLNAQHQAQQHQSQHPSMHDMAQAHLDRWGKRPRELEFDDLLEARMFRKLAQKMGQKLVKDPTYAQPLFDHASEAWDSNHQNQHLNMQTHHMAYQAQLNAQHQTQQHHSQHPATHDMVQAHQNLWGNKPRELEFDELD